MKPRTLILAVLGALAIACVAALAVHAHDLAQRRASLQQMALEVGSIAELRHPYMVPNHTGTRLLVNMDAQIGPAIYLYDLSANTSRSLYVENQKGYVYNHYKLLGWSPGDRYLAYGHQSEPRKELTNSVPGDLYVADGASGRTIVKIRVAADITNTLSQFAWLSTNSFCYLTGKQDLFVYEQMPEGWIQTRLFTNATGGKMFEAQSLIALSPNSVSWRMRDAVWKFDFSQGVPVNQWALLTNNFNTNRLIACSYSADTEKYLVVCYSRQDRQALYTFDPTAHSLTKITRIRQGVTADTPPTWINHNQGVSFLWPEMGVFSFMYCTNMYVPTMLATNMDDTNASLLPSTLFKRGETRIAAVAGDKVFVAGILSNEPPGIWEFDYLSNSVHCVVSPAIQGLVHVECPPYQFILTTNAAGQRYPYHIWTPTHFSESQKYPLIIGNSPYSWTPFPLACVNAGYCFVTVDRSSWTASMDDWTEKLMTTYNFLTTNSWIDTNRVYLCARSMESDPAARLYVKNPKMWHGMIFFDPTATLPDLPTANPPRVLIISGEFEKTEILRRLIEYQKRYLDSGNPVSLTVLSGAGHVSYGYGAQQQRIPALVQFLSQD